MRLNRRVLRTVIILLAVFVAFVFTLPITLPRGVRVRLVAALSERFDSRVELRDLNVSVLPRLRVAGEGLVLRHKARVDVPPLIVIKSFSAEASLFGLLGRPLRLKRVYLDGLEINVPPGGIDIEGDDKDRLDERAPPATANDQGAGPSKRDPPPGRETPLIVDDLLAESATLSILRRRPGKSARVFEIHHLSMQDTGADVPWRFRASLTNPTPPGRIETTGTFGPWVAGSPSATPLKGKYEFRDADLGVFEGIGGTLDSTGAFEGVLEQIEVAGRVNVPDFALADVGHPVALVAQFHSIVDGTSGNTWLQPVDAEFYDTRIRATGGVVERDGESGRTVSLDVEMNKGRIEDVLRLAARTRAPPMTGGMKLQAKFVLPPGPRDVIEKMRLDGSFQIVAARFTKGSVQSKIRELSQKARPGPEDPRENVASNFRGRFVMRSGVISLANVSFSMPGARVDVRGRYALRSEALDFRGTVRVDAKLSQMTSGMKSMLLRLVDPLFRRNNATVIPITVRGTVEAPKVRLDIKRALTRK
jgi:hypothetical protein